MSRFEAQSRPEIVSLFASFHNGPTSPDRGRKVFYFNHLRRPVASARMLNPQRINGTTRRTLAEPSPNPRRTLAEATMITIASIQVGNVITEGDPHTRDVLTRQWTTGFYKQPVAGPVKVQSMGIVGDAVADTRHHGGVDKAILCYANSHYRLWNAEHPDRDMSPGALGENLTVDACDESSVFIGDRYRVGTCELEISQPRQPCWKIARRWGIKTLTKEVTQTGRTGWYVRVVREGTFQSGDSFERLDRPNENWSVRRANDVLFGREVDRMAVIELMNLKELADDWKNDIA